LCEAANSVVQGQAQEEKLIAAAKAVAASTAQLLIACQVKADTRSENNRRLQVRNMNVTRRQYTLYVAQVCMQW
jgi:talin